MMSPEDREHPANLDNWMLYNGCLTYKPTGATADVSSMWVGDVSIHGTGYKACAFVLSSAWQCTLDRDNKIEPAVGRRIANAAVRMLLGPGRFKQFMGPTSAALRDHNAKLAL